MLAILGYIRKMKENENIICITHINNTHTYIRWRYRHLRVASSVREERIRV